MPSKSRKSLILTFALLALALPAVVSALNLVAPVSAKPAPPAPPAPCAANEVCFKLTLKAGDGKMLSSVPQFTLTTGGCAVSPTIVNGDGQPHVITADPGCVISLSAPTTNPSAEMFLFRGSTIASPKVTQTIVACGSGNCKSFNFAYYHLFFVSYSYANTGANPLPSVPTVHYTQLGRGLTLTAPLAPLATGEWTDAGTTSTFKNPLFSAPPPHQHDAKQHDNTNGNDATERWFASPSSCLVAGATTCTATYFDEFKNTYIAYPVLPPSEGGTPIAFEGGVRIPVNGLQGGNPAVVCTINTNDRRGSASCAGWTDSGSPATFGIYGTHGKGELWLAADYSNLVPWSFASAGNTAKDSYYQLFLLTVREHFTFSGPWHSTETKPHLSDMTIPQWVVRGSSVPITAIPPTQAPCVGSFVCTFTQWIGSGRGSVTTCKAGETCTTCRSGDDSWKPECAEAFSNPITVVVNNPVTETEVFTVTPSTPVGKMSPSISTALSATTITVGGPVYDTATLSGSTSTAGGTVQYKYYSGSSCSGTATAVGSPVTVTNHVVPNSDSVTFNSAGAYSWIAVYSGDSNNNAATSACESLGTSSTITFPGSSSTASGYLNQNGNAGSNTSQICNSGHSCFWITGGGSFDNGSITLIPITGLTQGEGIPCGSSSTCITFDISASGFGSSTMRNGVVDFCLSPVGGGLTTSSYLQYWNGSAWVTITTSVSPPTTICGQLPMSALTGTNLAVITPVITTTTTATSGGGGGGGGGSYVTTTTTSTTLTSTTTTTLRTTTSSTTSTTSTSSTSSTTSSTTTSSITTSPITSTTSTTSPTSTSSTSTGTTSVTTVTTTVPPSTTTMTTTSPLTTQLSSNGVIIASVAGVAVVVVIVGVLAARYVGGGRRRIRGESETGPISKPASTQ